MGCVALAGPPGLGGVELVLGEQHQQCSVSADELHAAAQENDAARLRQLTNLGLASDVIDAANAEGFTPSEKCEFDNIAAVHVLLTSS